VFPKPRRRECRAHARGRSRRPRRPGAQDAIRQHALRARGRPGPRVHTFKEPIARAALAAEGKRARIAWHEQERNGFTNVYLDRVEPLADEEEPGGGDPVDEVAWNATIEAAPWLLGTSAPKQPVPPEELFEKLQPFKELVAEDIRDGEDDG
jgi:hypothetical protein